MFLQNMNISSKRFLYLNSGSRLNVYICLFFFQIQKEMEVSHNVVMISGKLNKQRPLLLEMKNQRAFPDSFEMQACCCNTLIITRPNRTWNQTIWSDMSKTGFVTKRKSHCNCFFLERLCILWTTHKTLLWPHSKFDLYPLVQSPLKMFIFSQL